MELAGSAASSTQKDGLLPGSSQQWRGSAVTARKGNRSEADLEAGLVRSEPGASLACLVDCRAAHLRLAPAGLEWSWAREPSAEASSTSYLPFSEILSSWQLERGRGAAQARQHRLAVYTFARAPGNRAEWHPRRLVLSSHDQQQIRGLDADIRAGVSAAAGARPAHLLLLLNPASGARRARAMFKTIVEPVFSVAGVKVTVRETTHPGHAREIVCGLSRAEVRGIDGIVAMGGDGAFHECLNGVLAARAAAPPELAAELAALRLGHIPAGSTDAVACSLNGTRSAFTAAVHIALGDQAALDVLAVRSLTPAPGAQPGLPPLPPPGPVFSSCIAAAGFMGEVMVQAERLRWLGPLRYDVTGASVLLQNRPFPARVTWTEGAAPWRLGRAASGDTVCSADCGVCEAAAASALDSGPEGDSEWHATEGEFLSIMLIVSPCRSDKTRAGMARYGHLSDGRLKLVLVRRCGRLAYLRFLLRMASTGVYPGCCPHVEVRDAVAVRVELGGTATAAWNLDGELLTARAIRAEVQPSLVRVFARGVEA